MLLAVDALDQDWQIPAVEAASQTDDAVRLPVGQGPIQDQQIEAAGPDGGADAGQGPMGLVAQPRLLEGQREQVRDHRIILEQTDADRGCEGRRK